MGPGTRTDLVSRILSAIAIIALLTWGSYAIQFTQTSPGDQASIANYLASSTPQLYVNTAGNATISPGAEAQYIMTFQTNNPGNPQSIRALPSGLGYSFGPLTFDTTNNATFPHNTTYAVFTFLFGWQLGPNGGSVPSIWASTPSGIIHQPTITAPGYAGVDLYAKQGVAGFNENTGWATWILEVDTPGNYTLHFLNSGIAKAAGLVAMGYRHIVFSRSSPYLYAGITTIVAAAALGIGIGVEEWKRPRQLEERLPETHAYSEPYGEECLPEIGFQTNLGDEA